MKHLNPHVHFDKHSRQQSTVSPKEPRFHLTPRGHRAYLHLLPSLQVTPVHRNARYRKSGQAQTQQLHQRKEKRGTDRHFLPRSSQLSSSPTAMASARILTLKNSSRIPFPSKGGMPSNFLRREMCWENIPGHKPSRARLRFQVQ